MKITKNCVRRVFKVYLSKLSCTKPNTSLTCAYDAHRFLADEENLVRLHEHQHSDGCEIDVEEVDWEEYDKSVGEVEYIADERRLLEEAPRDQFVARHQMAVNRVVGQERRFDDAFKQVDAVSDQQRDEVGPHIECFLPHESDSGSPADTGKECR